MNYQCLVFSGGGVKTISYLGAIKRLEEQGVLLNIDHFAGTSIGGIFAFMLAIGTPFKDMFNTLYLDNIPELYSILGLSDFYYNFSITNIWKYLGKIINETGIVNSNNEKLLRWINDLLLKQELPQNCTFKQLYELKKKQLFIVGSNLSSNSSYYFNYNNTPNMYISSALCITMSYPFLYKQIKIDSQCFSDNIIPSNLPTKSWTDGGVFENFPIDCFDKIKPYSLTLGYYFITNDECPEYKKYILNKDRSIGIQLDNISTFTQLTPEIVNYLIDVGYQYTIL